MNILSRLKKIESRIIGNNSEFCDCVKEIQTFLILPSLENESVREPTEETDAPEFCETCRKRNPKTIEATFTITTRTLDEH